MKKKSQIQMMETIAVLLIFIIIVAIGLVFYFNMMSANTADKISQFQELSKIETAQIASSLPELQCSEDNILKSNCIDIFKLSAAGPVLQNNADYYFDLFGYSRITVESIFPFQGNWVLYDKVPAGEYSMIPTFFPISLYNATDDVNYFGLMVVEVYQ